ncbi:hypothetical protein [Pedobacter sp. NJ-S-72]
MAVPISDGDLAKPENVKVTVAKNTFEFTWDVDKTGIGSPNDRTMILLYNKVQKGFEACYSGARRSELKDVISDAVSKLFIAENGKALKGLKIYINQAC